MSDQLSGGPRALGDSGPRAAISVPGGSGGGRRALSVDWRRTSFVLLGLALFAAVYFAPTPSPAVDPQGDAFAMTREGKAALALFFLAATWWVTEVIPIGVTSIAIGVVQALFLIRPAREAFTDFMDPSVWFIFGSLVFGMVFTKTGLTRRLAYKMLSFVGERTSMIYLG
ncbi:MAG: anion permease, partial [Gemmatimonadales bacterium]